jgi:hypothetical protein
MSRERSTKKKLLMHSYFKVTEKCRALITATAKRLADDPPLTFELQTPIKEKAWIVQANTFIEEKT